MMNTGTAIALGAYFIAMLAVGIYAYRRSSPDLEGFVLGGRKMGPAVTALSAGASDMSGWMLMGLPGAMFLAGLGSAWIGLGLTVGAYVNYRILAPRLRIYTELAGNALTLPEFIENRFEDKSHQLRLLSSLVIVIFFTLYTSAGVVAGGKLFESSLGLSYDMGLIVTAGVVVMYTMFGGFLAVSLTDFLQGIIMLLALVILPAVAVFELGGPLQTLDKIEALNPLLLDAFTTTSGLAIVSSLAWGLGYFGQPHILVRFMAIRSAADLPTARRIGISWMTISLLGAMATGLTGAAYLSTAGIELKDPETIFMVLSQLLFHPLVAGFLLAAILAAIMSTLSSQLLVTSSSLTEDFYRTFFHRQASARQQLLVGRLSVALVAVIAVLLATDRSSSILSLVSNAWAGFGAAFGPLLLLSLYWRKMNRFGALASMITGAITVLLWIYLPIDASGQTLSATLYEMVPGFILSLLAAIVVSKLTAAPSAAIDRQFSEMLALCRQR
jgi:SSS family solute:Na+ symporter